MPVPAWAEARLAGEPARLAGPCVPDRATFVAGTVPGGFPRWRSCAADPTGTCSLRSADPEGTAPGTTSSGLSSSWSRGDSVAHSPTVPSAPEGSFGLTVSCPRTFRVIRDWHPRVFVAGSSVSGFSCVGRALPEQGAVAGWSVVSPGRGRGVRCGAAKRDGATCPGSPVALLVHARRHCGGGASACRPRPVRGGVPRQPFQPKLVWPQSRGCGGAMRLSARPRFPCRRSRGSVGSGLEDSKA